MEKRIATLNDERLYRADARGIGRSFGACMVCGGLPDALRNDCAFFVPSRETGEAIVAMFKLGARLDYRPYEPNWTQVKITACDTHRKNLIDFVAESRDTESRLDGPGISVEMVKRFTCS